MIPREIPNDMIESSNYKLPTRGTEFHLSLGDDVNPEVIKRALITIGVNATITPTTREHDGIILTDRMTSFTWDSQTDAHNCRRSCEHNNGAPHRPFGDLSPEQQFWFVNRVIDRMNITRGDMDMDLSSISTLGPEVAINECN